MPAMDSGRALATGEQALRQLMSAAFPRALGAGWLESISKKEQREKWLSRRSDEEAKRGKKGVAAVPQDLLAYAEFYELVEIAEKHWTHLSGALGKKADTGALLRRMENLRNTVGHSRELLPFEADLLSGIAGELRNRVAVYMSSEDPSGDFYPRIESITDQFGKTTTGSTALDGGTCHTGMSLPFGTSVAYQCRATDPKGRPLQWELVVGLRTRQSVIGSDVELTWSCDDPGDVGDHVRVEFWLTSDGKYHRHRTYDDSAVFIYRITPPTG
ncbi:hypothetical protein [Blastococcus sp. TF02-09]|uniref:hypothetical protein n=1 Tax=Blastococcus sp. TF02-09 TaxID=2250576 RepID=UPI0018F66246|nr:hypothetical protein [Blastococcus sp. TF02-9]